MVNDFSRTVLTEPLIQPRRETAQLRSTYNIAIIFGLVSRVV
jgi:hypothetical protein